MPLSEQEQRMLDEMERHLLQHDADVVTAPSGDRALSYRNLVYGALLLLAGIGGLIAAVAAGDRLGAVGSIILGVVAFLAMLGGAILAFTPVRRTAAPHAPSSPRGAKTRDSSFMDRMNDRWDRRQDER
ncbi:DUF3040 domain-containing protein [Microbacterium sp. nov. GSS16]|uniref:DUF3040 domain-containing protein n=1 Tax=Microbacterium sp. nov. GSS16 TaxID=3019890 RepID=UPI0023059F8D|nr:DUF3040 domain-containing protein [Microbacterium sp. nov. GSS16]MEE2814938.1 DUF3040 domain-containing protein [Actinomycetota bacterium]WCD91852.1 DUF3040 domain-containing protein [Microbacterium sp. nov. GSS16]